MGNSTRSFPTTKWSLVLSSASGAGSQAQEALAELCRTYWYPVYSFIRARRASADEAQDLTQEFFLQFLNKAILASANPAIGRFRSYLAASLKNFLADQADRQSARKRGGGATLVPIDFRGAEEKYARDLEDRETPEKIFDRHWAVAAVTQARDQLQHVLAHEGRENVFHKLRDYLPGGSEPPAGSYAALGSELGMSEGAIKAAIHRLRRRYRELLRANVSHTLADPKEVDDEIRFLLNSLSA
jgi:RNA polymerase sigma-70 factor (ECF subfamily)